MNRDVEKSRVRSNDRKLEQFSAGSGVNRLIWYNNAFSLEPQIGKNSIKLAIEYPKAVCIVPHESDVCLSKERNFGICGQLIKYRGSFASLHCLSADMLACNYKHVEFSCG